MHADQRTTRGLAPLLTLLAVAGAASAQATYVVGPNGLPTIGAALQVAQDGDVIQVEAGTYPAFQCDVGVAIRALVPGSVTIDNSAVTRFLLGPGKTVNLTDIDFRANVQIHNGRVAIVGSTFVGQGYAIYAQNADLHMVDSTVTLTGIAIFHTAAVRLGDCNLTAVDCTFAGGPAPWAPVEHSGRPVDPRPVAVVQGHQRPLVPAAGRADRRRCRALRRLLAGRASVAAPRSRAETLLLDEGLGTLGAQSLEAALGALNTLQATGCQVGVISHVEGVAERIGAVVEVQPEGGGQSRVRARLG